MSTDAHAPAAIVADTGLPDENWETFTEGKGKDKGKGKDHQGMGMPEVRPSLSDAVPSPLYPTADEIRRIRQYVEDMKGKGKDKGKDHEGKSSQGPYEVEGKGNDNDKGKSGKGSVHAEVQMCAVHGAAHAVYIPDPQEEAYWPGECDVDVVLARARALRAFGKGMGGECVCSDIERIRMYKEMCQEQAKHPTRWTSEMCHWCYKPLPAEFLEKVVWIPQLVMTDTQVPIVLEIDSVAKVRQAERREMTQTDFSNMLVWQEGIDNHLHNHSSKLTWFGEKLDATDNHMHNHSSKLDADMDHLKGNQDLLMEQIEQLRNMMGRMDHRAQEQASVMRHVMAGIGQLEYLIERIDQRLWPLERDAARANPDWRYDADE